MEQPILNTFEQSLSLSNRISLQTLASVRSLIINPNTSNSTLSFVFEVLTRSLQQSSPDAIPRHHTLKLLTDLSFHHPHFSSLIVDVLSANSLLSSESTGFSTDLLAALASISDHNPNLVPKIDDQFFVSLCFAPSVSVRVWCLRNAERFGVATHLLFTVFLGFTKDPYPYVRKVALDGLIGLSKSGVFEDLDMIKGCYCRAIELLCDPEDCVRRAAVRVVSEWGQMLVTCDQEMNRTDWSDAIFIQLCSMVRDMCMEVRAEALDALGKIQMVSEDILLQALSKKVLGVTKEKKSSQSTAENFKISASGAAGAFLHGLEDELFEVRMSACFAMRSFTVLSEKFASEAINLLVDLLNDDSVAVRLQALETMHHMANCEHLKLQEIHMHMFLGTLFDKCARVRSAARKILRLVTLPNMELFKLFINGLLETLEMYPQDEADAFSVLFYIGRSHGKYALCIIKEAFQEIEPDSDGKLGFDTARVAAFLVLAISVPFSCEQNVRCIPSRIFSYAVILLGRISHALGDVMDQHSLLTYLSHCSRLSSFSDKEVTGNGPSLSEVKSDDPNHASTDISSVVEIPVQEIGDQASGDQSWTQCKPPEDVTTSNARCQLEKEDEIRDSMNLVLAKVKNIWTLAQSGCTKEVLKTLRACKEEVLTFTTGCLGSDGALAFTLQYLQVVKLLAKVWEHFVHTKKLHNFKMGELELILGKLDRRLREIRCRFIGLSKEEELHVLELLLVACLLRLSKVEICCYLTTMKKLSSTISHIESLHEEGLSEPSEFVIELKKSLLEISTSTGTSSRPFMFNQLLKFFFLKQVMLSGRPRHIKAELDVPDNSSENPVSFISGLPVAIPLEVSLHNISSENRLWLKMTMSDESTRFVFLDRNLFGGCSEVQKFTYIAPVYITPKVVSFSLRVCIGMECLFEDIQLVKGSGGPKRALAYLCQEKEVYLSMASKGCSFTPWC